MHGLTNTKFIIKLLAVFYYLRLLFILKLPTTGCTTFNNTDYFRTFLSHWDTLRVSGQLSTVSVIIHNKLFTGSSKLHCYVTSAWLNQLDTT